MGPTETLSSLLEKLKVNKKLSKLDIQQAEQSLVQGLQIEENWPELIPYLFEFPADLSAHAFVSHWKMVESVVDKERFFSAYSKAMQGAPKYTVRGITTARELLHVNALFGFRLFCDVCEKVSDGGKKITNSKLLAEVRGMCTSGGLNAINPMTLRVTDLDFTSVSVVIAQSLSLPSIPRKHPNEVLDSLLWLNGFGRRVALNPSIMNKIAEETRDWREDEKQVLQNLGLRYGGSKPKVDAFRESSSSGESSSLGTPIDKGSSIDSILLPIKKYLEEAQKNTNSLQQELDRQLENCRLENEGRNKAERRITKLQEQVAELQLEVRHLVNTNDMLRTQVQDIANKLKQEEEKHSNEVDRLIDMSEHETNFMAQELKNKLAKLLRTEYLDFAEVQEEPMSTELGENMRVQLHHVFSTLRSVGIRIQ